MTSRRGFNDLSPLDLAYYWSRHRESNVLISYFPNLNGTSAQVLQFLVKSGRVEDLSHAIRKGMDVNYPCENGKRALDYALEMEHGEIIELLRNNKAISNLHWPAEKTKLCPYPMNLREPIATPLVSIEKEYDQEEVMTNCLIQQVIMLEIPIHTKSPIRSIVFETITAGKGPSTYQFPGTYISPNHNGLTVALQNQDGTPQRFIVQDIVQNSDDFRLHTNIWNLSEIDVSSPAKAIFMRNIRESSIVQIAGYSKDGSRYNRVKYIRVRMYGEEIHPST
ncbi:hypothetical protein NXS19_004705 [Fusarium pseudograminearum]|nr:hypothetical protein NXS19_004705 [Fusarium pseudograminearum]